VESQLTGSIGWTYLGGRYTRIAVSASVERDPFRLSGLAYSLTTLGTSYPDSGFAADTYFGQNMATPVDQLLMVVEQLRNTLDFVLNQDARCPLTPQVRATIKNAIRASDPFLSKPPPNNGDRCSLQIYVFDASKSQNDTSKPSAKTSKARLGWEYACDAFIKSASYNLVWTAVDKSTLDP